MVELHARRHRTCASRRRRSTPRSCGAWRRGMREHLPLIEGAVEAVDRVAGDFRLGLASSSNRPLIDAVLSSQGLRSCSKHRLVRGGRARQAGAGRLPARRRAGSASRPSGALRSKTLGTASGRRARPGMRVIAIPNRRYPPSEDALAVADTVLRSIAELTPTAMTPLTGRGPKLYAGPFHILYWLTPVRRSTLALLLVTREVRQNQLVAQRGRCADDRADSRRSSSGSFPG